MHPRPLIADAHFGVVAAGAIVTLINTRLRPQEVAYILDHSGSKLLLIDHELVDLVKGSKIPTVVSNDTGKAGDPYEEFLTGGRTYSQEKGWAGLDMEADENTAVVLCYT